MALQGLNETLGRRLVDGARLAHIFGKAVPVRARIHTVGGLSAHADRSGLLDWLRGFHRPPKHAYVVHGEAAASAVFAQAIQDELGWPRPHLPQLGERIDL
ncbi:MAG: MBL fold metallo-hydrolase RNA specificity domain-containing protein [Pseudomonadota bacterium]